MAVEVVRIIMYAHRELDLAEIAEALAVSTGVRNLSELERRKLRDPADVFEVCGRLIKQSPSSGRISLAHYSVYEFFSSPTMEAKGRNQYLIPKLVSSLELLRICVTYLAMDDFGLKSFEDSVSIALGALASEEGIVPQIFSDTPFLDYAARYWWRHLKDIEPATFDIVWPPLRRLVLAQRRNFNCLVMVCRYLNDGYNYPAGAEAIHVAALHGLEQLVLALVKEDDACRWSQTQDGRTALHIATEHGQDQIILPLVWSNPPPSQRLLDMQDKGGRTALHIAVESGNIQAVTALVKAGASVEVRSRDGTTPISIAVENSWEDVADLMSDRMKQAALAADGQTPLHLAAESGSLVWAESLIKRDQNLVNSRDGRGWSPIHHAAHNGHREMVDMLLKSGSYALPRDKTGWTPLHASILGRHLDCASSLLASNLHMYAPDELTDRSWSATRNESNLVSGRLQDSSSAKYGRYAGDPEAEGSSAPSRVPPSGASSVSASGASSVSATAPAPASPPLYIAVSESYTEGVILLLRSRERFPIDSETMSRCLRKALEPPLADSPVPELLSRNARESVVLDVLADMYTTAGQAFDPAYAAALRRALPARYVQEQLVPQALQTANEHICRFLLQNRNSTATVYMYPAGLVHKLLERPLAETAEQAAIRHHLAGRATIGAITPIAKQQTLQLLVDNGVSLSDLGPRGHTPLQACVHLREYDTARWLVRFGDVDARGRDGQTAMMVVAEVARHDETMPTITDLADLLIASGADIQAVDSQGRGICHRLAASGSGAQVVDWFLQRGARPEAVDKAGKAAIHVAMEHGFADGVRGLLAGLTKSTTPPERVAVFKYSDPADSLPTHAMQTNNTDVLKAVVGVETQVLASLERAESETVKSPRAAAYAEALSRAIRSGFEPGFSLLLSRMDIVSTADASGHALLHVASATPGREGYVAALLKKGADVHGKSAAHDNMTAAELAYAQRSVKTLALLIRHGAKPLREYLALSLDLESVELVTSLAERGMEFQPEDLQLAEKRRFTLPFTQLLLDLGLKVQLHHLELAVKEDDTALLRQVLETIPEGSGMDSIASALIAARFSSRQHLVEIMMNHAGSQLESLVATVEDDGQGGTVLHSAVKGRRPDQVKWILAGRGLGPDVLEAVDKVGYTALMAAMNTFNWECAEILIRCGAATGEAIEWTRKFPGFSSWNGAEIWSFAKQGPWGVSGLGEGKA